MSIEVIDTHSVNTALLEPEGHVLDVGCRGFEFARRMAEKKQYVLALDPDPKIEDPELSRVVFVRSALVTGPVRKAAYASWSTGEANHLCEGLPVPSYARASTVQCVNLEKLMSDYNVDRFEVVKLDCEGSEYDLLAEWPGPIAKQISVEFHDFTGFKPVGDLPEIHRKIMSRLAPWYVTVQHEKTPLGGIPGKPINYWDSLFVLRELAR